MKFKLNANMLALIALILLISIFLMINHLVEKKYITECFRNINSLETSNTVNMPLTTAYSCKNFCGPNSRCSITGNQCLADGDCPGCQPYSPPLPYEKKCIPANNGAGKLSIGVTPTYSSLTSGYGTREKIITKNVYAKPPEASFGYDTWSDSFNESQYLFNKRYKSKQLPNMPKYPKMYSLTGNFLTDGPLPSNY